MKKEIKIPENRIGWLTTSIDKFNKKSEKLGFSPFTITEIKKELEPKFTGTFLNDGSRQYISVMFYTFIIEGEIPKINGWELIARTEHFKDGRNVIYKFGIDTELDQYRERIKCDHCDHNRFRKYTWILKAKNGRKKQVGTTCIKDFTGHDPSKIIDLIKNFETIIDESEPKDDDWGFGNGRGIRYIPITEWVARTYHYLVKLGGFYVSNTKARDEDKESTSTIITNSIFGIGLGLEWKDVYDFEVIPNDDDYKNAKKIIKWLKALDNNKDYWYTLRMLVETDTVDIKYNGYITSIVPSWIRETKRQMEQRANKKKSKKSEFVGAIGERETFTLTLKKIHGYDGYWGWSYIYSFEDPDGNNVKWFSTNNCLWDEDNSCVGTTYSIKGRVKNHEDHETYGKSTIITRCSILEGIK